MSVTVREAEKGRYIPVLSLSPFERAGDSNRLHLHKEGGARASRRPISTLQTAANCLLHTFANANIFGRATLEITRLFRRDASYPDTLNSY